MTTRIAAGAHNRSSAFFGSAAIACFVYAAAALLLMHVLRPDYSPSSHMISDYAVGPYGWVMQSVFVAMSVGCTMLLVGLTRNGPTSLAARIAIVLLAVASIGLIVSAIFPTDVLGAPSTQSGHIHTVSFFVNIVSIILAVVVLTMAFGSDPRWHSYRHTSMALLFLITLAFVLQFLTLRKGAPYGLANRFFVCVLFAWFIATANRLRNVTR